MANRVEYSQLPVTYDNPYYRPVTPEQTAQTVQSIINQERRDGLAVIRTNILRYLSLGSLAYIIAYPLTRLTHMQMVRPDVRFLVPEVNYRWTALKFIIQKEGPTHLWRGVVPGLAYFNASVLSAYYLGSALDRPDTADTPQDRSDAEAIFTGLFDTTFLTAGQFIIHPLRVAQIKIATDIKVKSLSTWYRYATSIDCLVRVFRYNGISGLYAGAGLMAIRNYILWAALWFYFSKLYEEDQSRGTNDGLHPHEYRYEFRALMAYLALYPFDHIITRRIYRVPTFKTDKLPRQFPKMWLPTFSGFIPIYRGLIAFYFFHVWMLFVSHWTQNKAREDLLPPIAKPSMIRLLQNARYAHYKRQTDELRGIVGQYPMVNPTDTSNLHYLRQRTKYFHNGRFTIPSEGAQDPNHPNTTFNGDSMALPDIQAITHGHYDMNATTFTPPNAGSSRPNPTIGTREQLKNI